MPAFPRRGTGGDRNGSRPTRTPLSRRFTYRYVLAIALFLGVALAAKLSGDASLAELDRLSRQLEEASSQPARVTALADLAEEVALQPDVLTPEQETAVAESASRLEQDATRILKVQEGLLNGDLQLDLPATELSPELEDLYQGDTDPLAQNVESIGRSALNIADFSESSPDNARLRINDLNVITTLLPQTVDDLQEANTLYAAAIQDTVDTRAGANEIFLAAYAAVAVFSWLVLFRPMAKSIHRETSQLEEAERIHRENNERQSFRNDLAQVLDNCESEYEVLEAVGRAMNQIIPEYRAEVLLANASRTQLRREKVSPSRGAAGCPVDGPMGCPAIRRGQSLTFESSRMLNVCPKLPEHAEDACSAVCVPLTFQGDTLGVLHTVGPDGDPPDQNQADRLKVLGQETASTIVAMRAKQSDQHEAVTDRLTGLANRRAVEKTVANLLRDGHEFAVAMADLDHFKQLNDTHGHEAGDRALQLFANVLTDQLRPEDTPARYGGEEFLVVLPDAGLREALSVLERLQGALAAEVATDDLTPFTASWGLTHSRAGDTLAEIVAVADTALYQAKRDGRDTIRMDQETAAEFGLSSSPGGDGTGDLTLADGILDVELSERAVDGP